MNYERMKNEPGLVCTCNDIYREAIVEEVGAGCEDAEELMYSIASDFRCGECKPIIERIIREEADKQNK